MDDVNANNIQNKILNDNSNLNNSQSEEEENSYSEENELDQNSRTNERYGPINSVILEVSEYKETSMYNSKLDQSILKNNSILLSTSQLNLNDKKIENNNENNNSIINNSIINNVNSSINNNNNSINNNINTNNNTNNTNINKTNYDNTNTDNTNINNTNTNNNNNNFNISESFLNDSDDENNEVLKEIIRTAKMREMEERKKKNEKKNVKFEIKYNVEMLYKENDKITNMEIINWENNNKEKFIPKDLSNYKNILQSHNKVKPIIKEFNKNEILIDPNYVLDVDYLIDETNINDSSNID